MNVIHAFFGYFFPWTKKQVVHLNDSMNMSSITPLLYGIVEAKLAGWHVSDKNKTDTLFTGWMDHLDFSQVWDTECSFLCVVSVIFIIQMLFNNVKYSTYVEVYLLYTHTICHLQCYINWTGEYLLFVLWWKHESLIYMTIN